MISFQYAIVFKTPAYHNPNIDRQKYVQVQLKRRTDGDTSDPKPFTYFPKEHGKCIVIPGQKDPTDIAFSYVEFKVTTSTML